MGDIIVRADLLQGTNRYATIEIEGGPSTVVFTLQIDIETSTGGVASGMQTYLETFPIGTTQEDVRDGIMNTFRTSPATFPDAALIPTSTSAGGIEIRVVVGAAHMIDHLDWGYSVGTSILATPAAPAGGCPVNYIQPTTLANTDNTSIPALEACDGGPRRYAY